MCRCPVCGNNQLCSPLFTPGPQPLASVSLPDTVEDAEAALRYPMEYLHCTLCGHVWNHLFDETKIPYNKDSNLMFNQGASWQRHLSEVAHIVATCTRPGLVIDIGCADGQFFDKLAEEIPKHQFLGFEPGIDAAKCHQHRVIQDYFIPTRDLRKYKPATIVCRHVLEHMKQPREFLTDLAYRCFEYGLTPTCIFEVPMFDKAMESVRLCDFQYEHVSNFTGQSFLTLVERSEFAVTQHRRLYGDEVQLVVCQPLYSNFKAAKKNLMGYTAFSEGITRNLREELWCLTQTYKKVALWGGGGKGAAVINILELGREDFPLVFDSDKAKSGKYVPYTGQCIRHTEEFNCAGVDAIVILTPWRAADIVSEVMQVCGFTGDCYTFGDHGNLEKI